MLRHFSIRSHILGTTLIAGMLFVPAGMLAADHVVSTADLSQAARSVASQREQNIAKLHDFLSSDEAREAMAHAKLDPVKINTAVAQLNDAELSRLAARADQAQKDFAAGDLTKQQTTLIIVAAAVVAIVIAIAAS
jgi:hypothetical protein